MSVLNPTFNVFDINHYDEIQNKVLISIRREENQEKKEEYLSTFATIDESAKRALYELNKEFINSPVLKNMLVYRWYPANPIARIPYVGPIPFVGHAHLDINEHECFAFLGSVNKKMKRQIPHDKGSYHHAIHLNLKPNELIKLSEFLDSIDPQFGKGIAFSTCAGSSAIILRRYTEINIPRPIALIPAASAIYLHVSKFLGNNRIGSIHFRGSENSITPLIVRLSMVMDLYAFIYVVTTLVDALPAIIDLIYDKLIANLLLSDNFSDPGNLVLTMIMLLNIVGMACVFTRE